jgi:hypothetical protein
MIHVITSSSIRGLPSLLVCIIVWEEGIFLYCIVIISHKIICCKPIFFWYDMQAPFACNWFEDFLSSYFGILALKSLTIILNHVLEFFDISD